MSGVELIGEWHPISGEALDRWLGLYGFKRHAGETDDDVRRRWKDVFYPKADPFTFDIDLAYYLQRADYSAASRAVALRAATAANQAKRAHHG